MKEESDSENYRRSVTCIAPINIAIVKYWGKKDEELNIPLNSSLSVTLDMANFFTKTTIKVNSDAQSYLELNGKKTDILEGSRIHRVLKYMAKHDHHQSCFSIVSKNNFPTGCGMASSASGFCSIATCFSHLYTLSQVETAQLARLGSGSASRSIYGGFVEWDKGSKNDGTDCLPHQIAGSNHWPELLIVAIVVSKSVKANSSTKAMKRSAETSNFLKYRADFVVPENLSNMKKALYDKNFNEFGKLIIQESNSFHAVCLDTYPPIEPPYLNSTSHEIIELITNWNNHNKYLKAAYTFDAGPNAFVFLLSKDLKEFLHLLKFKFSQTLEVYNYNDFASLIEAQNYDDQSFINSIKTDESHSKKQLEQIVIFKVGDGPKILPN